MSVMNSKALPAKKPVDIEMAPKPKPAEKPFQPNMNDPKLGKPTPEAQAARKVQKPSKPTDAMEDPFPRLVTRINRQ
jgi:hypothetical protein